MDKTNPAHFSKIRKIGGIFFDLLLKNKNVSMLEKIKKRNVVHYSPLVKMIAFSVLLTTQFNICAEEITPTAGISNAPVFNNNPAYNPNNNNNNPIFNVKPHIEVNTLSYVTGMAIKNFTMQCINSVQEKITADNYGRAKDALKKLLWEKRYQLIGGTLLGAYSTASLLLASDYYFINNQLRWAQWKSDMSSEELYAIPQRDLAHELLLAIGQRYYNKKNPTDMAQPLLTFITVIDTEIGVLKRYLRTAKIIRTLQLIPLLPTNNNKIAYAQKSLERTLFVKHIFLSWLSEYNVANTHTQKGAL